MRKDICNAYLTKTSILNMLRMSQKEAIYFPVFLRRGKKKRLLRFSNRYITDKDNQMANKHEMCLISLFIKEIKLKSQ